jgi:hypothetical protein
MRSKNSFIKIHKTENASKPLDANADRDKNGRDGPRRFFDSISLEKYAPLVVISTVVNS